MDNSSKKENQHNTTLIVQKSSIISITQSSNESCISTCNNLRKALASNFGLYSATSNTSLPTLNTFINSTLLDRFESNGFNKCTHTKSTTLNSKYFLKTEPIHDFWMGAFCRELMIWEYLDRMRDKINVKIVPQFIAGWMCEGRGYTLTEMIHGKTLDKLLLESKDNNNEDLKRVIGITLTKIRAMNRMGVKHNDLHCGNIIVNADLTDAFIIDFGCAELITGETLIDECNLFNEELKSLYK